MANYSFFFQGEVCARESHSSYKFLFFLFFFAEDPVKKIFLREIFYVILNASLHTSLAIGNGAFFFVNHTTV